jgi:hypothetical protein
MYTCQFCGQGPLEEILFLGSLPPVNDMHAASKPIQETTIYPLPFCYCEKCELAQIGTTLTKEVVFPRSYPYLSGMTKSLVKNFEEQAHSIHSVINLKKSDLVVDIGSNDGSLLKNYLNFSKVLGIEPTQAADVANSNGIETINSYFDEDTTHVIVEKFGKAKVITACNVFAHIDNIKSLLQNVENILSDNGIFVSESHYLLDLINTLQFDTIYHEHLRYYSVTFLKKMFKESGLEIFRVDSIQSHGGSIRVWTCKTGTRPVEKSVFEFIQKESDSGLTSIEGLRNFAADVIEWRNSFRKLIAELKIGGSIIGAIGAPSRASTLVTFSGLTELDLIAVGEVQNSTKIGKYMPGTRIPVIPESTLLDSNPDYLLVLSWHIKDALIVALKNKGYKGKFIIPLPIPTVIE